MWVRKISYCFGIRLSGKTVLSQVSDMEVFYPFLAGGRLLILRLVDLTHAALTDLGGNLVMSKSFHDPGHIHPSRKILAFVLLINS